MNITQNEKENLYYNKNRSRSNSKITNLNSNSKTKPNTAMFINMYRYADQGKNITNNSEKAGNNITIDFLSIKNKDTIQKEKKFFSVSKLKNINFNNNKSNNNNLEKITVEKKEEDSRSINKIKNDSKNKPLNLNSTNNKSKSVSILRLKKDSDNNLNSKNKIYLNKECDENNLYFESKNFLVNKPIKNLLIDKKDNFVNENKYIINDINEKIQINDYGNRKFSEDKNVFNCIDIVDHENLKIEKNDNMNKKELFLNDNTEDNFVVMKKDNHPKSVKNIFETNNNYNNNLNVGIFIKEKIFNNKTKKSELINNNPSANRLLTRNELNNKLKIQNTKGSEGNQLTIVKEKLIDINSINPKRFIVIGGYPAIKEALLKRNFIESNDYEGNDYELKWTLKMKDIKYEILKPFQIVNHFKNNTELTKKSGLTKNLKTLIYKNVDIDNFYPRCYDISERNDFEDFMEDFKITKLISLLKEYSENSRTENIISFQKVICCLDIIERKINEWNTPLLSRRLITDKEWSIISEEDIINYRKELERLERMNKIGFSILSKKHNNINNNNNISENILIEKNNNFREENINVISNGNKYFNKTEYDLKNIVNSYLVKLKTLFPQYEINGKKNIWIMKPSGLSRGRGIKCVNSLNEILLFIKKNSNQYMVQKYIENPLLVLGRKFDIRQWVLVTDYDPLTIWMWDTPYIRFGAEDYNIEDINNLFSHLTNNSIAKCSKNFYDNKIEGNMWDVETFTEYLKRVYNRDVWREQIKEKIKKIVISSLESVKNLVVNRKNSHEIYGYDIMIDDELNCWLIEVNSSPAMDYSTNITERLVKEMSEDLIKVVVDYNLSQSEEKMNISTGNFVLTPVTKSENNLIPNPELSRG